MLDLPKKTLFFHSVFSLRYCAALENTNCLRYRPDDSSAIPELTVAAGDTAVPELVADRRARALWTKIMKTLIITFHTLVLAEEGGREVRLSRRFSHGHNRRASNICRLACQTVTGWKNSATACSSHNALAVQVPTVRSAMRVTMKRDKSSYLSFVLLIYLYRLYNLAPSWRFCLQKVRLEAKKKATPGTIFIIKLHRTRITKLVTHTFHS